MGRSAKWFAGLALGLFMMSPALGQDRENQQRDDKQRRTTETTTTETQTTTQRSADTEGQAGSRTDVKTNIHRASKLDGFKVTNREGQDLGKVEDFVVDLDEGRLAFAVISFGGFLGVGDRHFAIPYMALGTEEGRTSYVVHIDKEKLLAAPEFTDSVNLSDRSWTQRLYQHYGFKPYWRTSGAIQGAGQENQARATEGNVRGTVDDQKVANTQAGTAGMKMRGFQRLSKINGAAIQNANGERLGSIEDLAVNINDGKVMYAVLSFGGLLGVGDKLFAIPWESLKMQPMEDYFVLNATKAQFENAPGFDKNNWPNMNDPNWATSVRKFHIRSANNQADGDGVNRTNNNQTNRDNP